MMSYSLLDLWEKIQQNFDENNKFHLWNFDIKKTTNLLQSNAFENDICKMVSILFRSLSMFAGSIWLQT